MPDMMRAMVLERLGPIEQKPLKLSNIPRHRIQAPNQILIKIRACGVCHSQLHSIEGDWTDLGIPPALPTVPGHEIVGEVVEVGPDVTKFRIGDHAGVSPLMESCQRCEYCLEGRENLCDDSIILGESMRGGYSEFVNVSEDFAVKVPKTIPFERAAPLFCAGITAYKAVKAAEPHRCKNVAIFGVGGVGHMAIQFSKMEGLEVVAVSRAAHHLDVAKRLGADHTIRYGPSVLDEIARLGRLDAAIVLAPSDEVTRTAIAAVKKGGTVVIATIGRIEGFVAFEEKTVRGTLIGSTKDMEDVVRLAEQNNMEVMVETHQLEEANEVLQNLKNSKIDARAVLVI